MKAKYLLKADAPRATTRGPSPEWRRPAVWAILGDEAARVVAVSGPKGLTHEALSEPVTVPLTAFLASYERMP